ncbi:hypothetical protein AOLI_G00120030 [Acnodon oligacanthus]
MIIVLIALTASLCLTGSSSSIKNVHLTPPDLIKNKDESADLYCSHSVPNHDIILCFKLNYAILFQFGISKSQHDQSYYNTASLTLLDPRCCESK